MRCSIPFLKIMHKWSIKKNSVILSNFLILSFVEIRCLHRRKKKLVRKTVFFHSHLVCWLHAGEEQTKLINQAIHNKKSSQLTSNSYHTDCIHFTNRLSNRINLFVLAMRSEFPNVHRHRTPNLLIFDFCSNISISLDRISLRILELINHG